MFGMGLGTLTVTVPQLRMRANSTEAVSKTMASWIASIHGFSSIPSVCIFVITSHYIGRKKPWIFTTVITFISFTILYFSKNSVHVFICILLVGVTGSAQISISIMIMTECATPRYRGLIFAIKSASNNWGVWCANAIGTFSSYNYIGIVGMVCSVVNFIIIIYFIPETPFWLAFNGRFDDCVIAHRWFKGDDEDTEKELTVLIKSRKDQQHSMKKYSCLLSYFKKYITILCQPHFYKPVSLGILVMFMLCTSGKLVYSVYAVEILLRITKVRSTAHNVMLILDGCSVIGMYLGCVLVNIFKRRTLFLSLSTASAMLTFIMSLYLYLVKLHYLTEDNYISISILILYSISTSCGPVLLVSAICSELFPLKHRSFAVLFVAVLKGLIFGTFIKFTPSLFDVFDIHGMFLFYAILFSVCIILAYTFLPETKDKTLCEIADMFK